MSVNSDFTELSEVIAEDAALVLLATDRRSLRRAIRAGRVPAPGRAGFATVTLIPAWFAFLKSDEITAGEAGELLNLSAQRIGQLVAGGYIERNERGAVTRQGVLRGYARFLATGSERGEASEAAARWQDTKSRKAEMEMAILDGRLIETKEARTIVAEIIRIFTEELAKAPTDFGDNPAIRQRIKTAADEITERAYRTSQERFAKIENKH